MRQNMPASPRHSMFTNIMYTIMKISLPKLNSVVVVWAALLFITACKQPDHQPGTDVTGQRVDSLLSLMTLDEKIGQLTLFTSDYDVTGPSIREGYKDDIKAGRVGAIFNAFGATYTRKLQEI